MMVNTTTCRTFNNEPNEEQRFCACVLVCVTWDQGESREAGKWSVTHGEWEVEDSEDQNRWRAPLACPLSFSISCSLSLPDLNGCGFSHRSQLGLMKYYLIVVIHHISWHEGCVCVRVCVWVRGDAVGTRPPAITAAQGQKGRPGWGEYFFFLWYKDTHRHMHTRTDSQRRAQNHQLLQTHRAKPQSNCPALAPGNGYKHHQKECFLSTVRTQT